MERPPTITENQAEAILANQIKALETDLKGIGFARVTLDNTKAEVNAKVFAPLIEQIEALQEKIDKTTFAPTLAILEKLETQVNNRLEFLKRFAEWADGE